MGIGPAWAGVHQHPKLARLPIPAHPHVGEWTPGGIRTHMPCQAADLKSAKYNSSTTGAETKWEGLDQPPNPPSPTKWGARCVMIRCPPQHRELCLKEKHDINNVLRFFDSAL